MSAFPLYTTLQNNLPKKDLTIAQKNDLIKRITNFDTEVHELIYALIKCFYLDRDKGQTLSVPYNGQFSKNKIEFDLTDFPTELRQLLYKFITVHMKKIDEDKVIEEIHQSHSLEEN